MSVPKSHLHGLESILILTHWIICGRYLEHWEVGGIIRRFSYPILSHYFDLISNLMYPNFTVSNGNSTKSIQIITDSISLNSNAFCRTSCFSLHWLGLIGFWGLPFLLQIRRLKMGHINWTENKVTSHNLAHQKCTKIIHWITPVSALCVQVLYTSLPRQLLNWHM